MRLPKANGSTRKRSETGKAEGAAAWLRLLDISGPTEPAHGLYDLCANMIERNEIAYISPTKCLPRQQELVGNKPEKEIQLDASKTALVIKEQVGG